MPFGTQYESSTAHPTLARGRAGLEEALKRKDAIIRVRNAQISALWDELHTRQPWTNALAGDAPINLARLETANASRKLLVIGINTVRAPGCSLQEPGLVSACCLLRAPCCTRQGLCLFMLVYQGVALGGVPAVVLHC